MELIGHCIGRVNILDVVVVQFDIGGQRQSVGRGQVLLVSLVVQLIALLGGNRCVTASSTPSLL